MLRLSKMADYAGVIVVHIASAPSRVHTASSLSDELRLPKATVAKCLKVLAKHNVLTSSRGVNGGYALARPAKEIPVAEVIFALEGPVQITSCAPGHVAESCHISGTCPMRGGWDSINGKILNMLRETSVADMARAGSAGGGAQTGK